ncbi:hypothetical protein COU57_04900 [Candidatus Pacearchaeota archaeon CG10_big_fil_rev_8_21_14_0_10_32_14]|nr:MAG: hypothetical protein COU57_04900 [Candidatus Pacearchaeota archaeon CG10_big_fil_rev_8_21_14_0_10_32_14]
MKNSENITRKKFNSLKKYYDKTWDEKNHTLHVGYFENGAKSLQKAYKDATLNLIEKINRVSEIKESSIVLDIGCGTGRTLADICKKYGCRGVGIDLSDEMIKDAKQHLNVLNRNTGNKINIKFIRASGSDLKKTFKQKEIFTHIISQDALFLVNDKKSLYEGIGKLLVKDGAFAIDDFLSEKNKETLKENDKKLVYNLVNWSEGLSFEIYKKVLNSNNLEVTYSENMKKDIIITYKLLSKKMEKYLASKDVHYITLYERYMAIVKQVKNNEMGWGIFIGIKR